MSNNEPLGLNRGSVRAILAIGSFAAFVVSMFVPGVDSGSRTALGTIASGVITYYFNSRPPASGAANV